MTPPFANLIPIENYPIMDARHRKILKLEIMREKSIARRRQQADNTVDGPDRAQNSDRDNILPQLEDSKFSDIDSVRDESSYEVSKLLTLELRQRHPWCLRRTRRVSSQASGLVPGDDNRWRWTHRRQTPIPRDYLQPQVNKIIEADHRLQENSQPQKEPITPAGNPTATTAIPTTPSHERTTKYVHSQLFRQQRSSALQEIARSPSGGTDRVPR